MAIGPSSVDAQAMSRQTTNPTPSRTTPRAPARRFVYAVCGDAHAARVNVSLRFLKRYSRAEIVVVTSRTGARIEHDQVVDVATDASLDDHRASIMLKTGLHAILGGGGSVFCYLDSDVIAVGDAVDSIFDQRRGAVVFVRDHADLPRFSRCAVRCGCPSPGCRHLVDAIKSTFGVTIADPNWRHWNGGVFVFDDDAAPLLDRWRAFTLRILDDPYWFPRDQGTLAAAAWDLGWQDAPVLPGKFNTIVDCYAGIPEAQRQSAPVAFLPVDRSYRLDGPSEGCPVFLHFVNGGVSRCGWKNWDDAEALLRDGDLPPPPICTHSIGETNGQGGSRPLIAPATVAQAIPEAPMSEAAPRQPPAPAFRDTRHLNILCPSLTLGGAERIVVETIRGLANTRATVNLFVAHEAHPSYELEETERTRVVRLAGLNAAARMRAVALDVLASSNPIVLTHMIRAADLRLLWDHGVRTVPVVHNAEPSWQDPPGAFSHANVPFVAAVSEAVAAQLQDRGCTRPVITVRHELQRWFSAEELRENRRAIRNAYGLTDDMLLIGMVGEFKSQKAYPRAVEVLEIVRRRQKAKLMILGGWDHDWGHGRATFTATCRQAIELGVMPDILTPGRVRDVEPYYSAFDVFLNTSDYEGLSIATLEAAQSGCPIVVSDAGGNAEALPPQAVVVADPSDIGGYVSGIERVLCQKIRRLPGRPADHDLVPRLWTMLADYAVPELYPPGGDDVLFLTDNLNVGGAAWALVNHLCAICDTVPPWLGVLHTSNRPPHVDALAAADVHVFATLGAETYLERAEQCLHMIRQLGARRVVFWNLDARVKLLLAKVLPSRDVRLVDVSPDQLLFDESEDHAKLPKRIAFSRAQYFARIEPLESADDPREVASRTVI
jgi:glycosyltransferase involved in cell wall biosynthesis